MKRMTAAAILVLAASAHGQEGTTTYYVGHHEKFVNISFESHADIETIVGATNKASGEIRTDGKGSGSVSLSVPVVSMRTGIEDRDKHLQSKDWLNAEKHPNITFKSKKVQPVPEKADWVEVTGDFGMHGVTREMVVKARWQPLSEEATRNAKFPEGKWMKFSGDFEVKLSDHGVKIPEFVVGKVSDTWKVKMTLFGCTTKPEQK